MNSSTVPHSEVGLRLTICSEFLLNEEKPAEEVYGSWMRRVGGQLIEFAEFGYWYRRFKNNQFDLGYDTSQDSKESSEIYEIQKNMELESDEAKKLGKKSVEIADTLDGIAHEKIDHRFDIQNVPVIFQELINEKKSSIQKIYLGIYSYCSLSFDNLNVSFETNNHGYTITYRESYQEVIETVETVDLEKSIVDHLWFVLRDQNIKLTRFDLGDFGSMDDDLLDFDKLNTMVQSMLNSFDHQIHTSSLHTQNFNEDTLYSMLKRVKPGTLESISFEISGDCRKLKEIVKLDQWKQAKEVWSTKPTSLTIDDVSHCKTISLNFEELTPEDVVRVRDHFLKLPNTDFCVLSIKKGDRLNFGTMGRALQSGNLRPRIAGRDKTRQIIYRFSLQNSQKILRVILNKDIIVFTRVEKNE